MGLTVFVCGGFSMRLGLGVSEVFFGDASGIWVGFDFGIGIGNVILCSPS